MIHRQLNPAIGRLLVLCLTALWLTACGGADEGDLSAPSLTYSGTAATTTSATRYLAGTVEAGARLTVTTATAAQVEALTVADGRWACTISGLVEGANLVTVQAVDAAENQQTLTFSLPYEPLSFATYRTPLPGSSLTVGGLADATGTLSVSVAAPATVTAPMISGDHWQAQVSGLAAGENRIMARLERPGLAPLEKSLTVTVDAAAPRLTIDPVTSPTAQASQSLTGSRDQGLQVGVLAPTATVGTVDLTTDPERWNAPLQDLTLGQNPVTVSATGGTVASVAHTLLVYAPQQLVIDRRPVPQASAVDSDTKVQAVFAVPMAPATIDGASFVLTGPDGVVAASVDYDPALRLATLAPAAPLSAGQGYTATLTTAVTAADGEALGQELSWRFTVR